MLQKSDREELERKLEQTTRLASLTSDQTTLQRLMEFADELRQKVEYFLAKPTERREIVEALRSTVSRECTLDGTGQQPLDF